jgi:S-methylmethionine-dependent homocysteine/selenocysteine methylase
VDATMTERNPKILLLDGATGTELERRGVVTELPLWSATAVRDAPDVLREIHASYLRAGADAITTSTFRAHRRSLAKAGREGEAAGLVAESVALARAVRDEIKPDALVLGSVGPLEDCYSPDLAPSSGVAEGEHREIMAELLDAGVDRLLIETVGTTREATAAAKAARALAPGRWMISFTPKRVGPPGLLQDGSSLIDLMPALQGARALGVNCVAPEVVLTHVTLLATLIHDDRPILAYANCGHQDRDGHWVAGAPITPAAYAAYAKAWVDAGATVIGGCCGTTAETIDAVNRALR